MKVWQTVTFLVFIATNLAMFAKGVYECRVKENAYGATPAWLILFGAIAWGDAVVFGPFWVASVMVSCLLKDWHLFLLIVSVFWVIRSLGETIYWFNQQFSSKVYEWNDPQNLKFHSIFRNDSVWFIYQICWQCAAVVSIIFSIYFAGAWLGGF